MKNFLFNYIMSIDYAKTGTYIYHKNSASYIIADGDCTNITMPDPEEQIDIVTIVNKSTIDITIKYSNNTTITTLNVGQTIELLPAEFKYELVARTSSGTVTGDFLPRDGSLPMIGDLSISNHRVKDVVNPVEDYDVANKQYVDFYIGLANDSINDVSAQLNSTRPAVVLKATNVQATGAIAHNRWFYDSLNASYPVAHDTPGYIRFAANSPIIGQRCLITVTIQLNNAPSSTSISTLLQIREDFTVFFGKDIFWPASVHGNTYPILTSTIMYDITEATNFALQLSNPLSTDALVVITALGSSSTDFIPLV